MEAESQEVQTAAGDALAAVEDLIIFTLKDTSAPDRFAEAHRLCEIAQSLVKARARRAVDFADPDVSAPSGQSIFVGGNQYNNAITYNDQRAAMQQHVQAMLTIPMVNTANTGIITTGNFIPNTYTTITVPAGPYVV